MIKRSTWIVLAIFLILIALAIYLQNRPESEEPELTATSGLSDLTEVEPLFEVEEAESISSISVVDAQGREIAFDQEAELGWTMVVSDTQEAVDTTAFDRSVASLRTLTSSAELDPETELSAVGLEQPSYSLTVETDQGDTYEIAVGAETITGNQYYVSVNDGAPLVVDKFTLDTFFGYLANPPYQPTPTPELTPTPAAADSTGEDGSNNEP